VASRFNEFVVTGLINGACDTMHKYGIAAANLRLVRVPGAFELPLAVKRLALAGQCDGIVALGAVIRGETPHFDYVASVCANGLNQVMLETGIPIGFGVLTSNTVEQAIERTGGKAGNKGAEAALAVLEMAALLPQLDEQ
jgi:6,7-dimethyl-8-ribityllumazine synthase